MFRIPELRICAPVALPFACAPDGLASGLIGVLTVFDAAAVCVSNLSCAALLIWHSVVLVTLTVKVTNPPAPAATGPTDQDTEFTGEPDCEQFGLQLANTVPAGIESLTTAVWAAAVPVLL